MGCLSKLWGASYVTSVPTQYVLLPNGLFGLILIDIFGGDIVVGVGISVSDLLLLCFWFGQRNFFLIGSMLMSRRIGQEVRMMLCRCKVSIRLTRRE